MGRRARIGPGWRVLLHVPRRRPGGRRLLLYLRKTRQPSPTRHHHRGVDVGSNASITAAVSGTRAPGDRMTQVKEEPTGLRQQARWRGTRSQPVTRWPRPTTCVEWVCKTLTESSLSQRQQRAASGRGSRHQGATNRAVQRANVVRPASGGRAGRRGGHRRLTRPTTAPGRQRRPGTHRCPGRPRLHDAPFDAAPAVLAGAEAGASLPDTLGR